MKTVHTGIEIAKRNSFDLLSGARVGLVCNQASVDNCGKHLVDLVLEIEHCSLKRIFAPEHGYQGLAQDMESVENETYEQLEVVSLYGNDEDSLKPDPKDFEDLDVLVIDLPDIGSRYYTYSQTMAYCMDAAGTTGTRVIVFDRPNPIGGIQIEGSPLLRDYQSFCGIGPLANRHGMTLGELAYMFQTGFGDGEHAIPPHPCELEVVQIEHWQRSQYLGETGIPWIKPSPNMPNLDAATVYPGTCLFEATNLSEGRGTDEAFLLIGAPFANADAWLSELKELGEPIEGCRIEPTTFTPRYQKHAGIECEGLHLIVENRSLLQSYRLGIMLLVAAARAFPSAFEWRKEPYEFISHVPAIDLLYGSPTLRLVIEGKERLSQVFNELERFETWYGETRKPFLIY